MSLEVITHVGTVEVVSSSLTSGEDGNKLKPIDMASCNKCKKPVGCGCNLSKNNLCATCEQEKQKQEAEAAAKKDENPK